MKQQQITDLFGSLEYMLSYLQSFIILGLAIFIAYKYIKRQMKKFDPASNKTYAQVIGKEKIARCNIQNCPFKYQYHYKHKCQFCQGQDIDHFSSDCKDILLPKLNSYEIKKCKIKNCFEVHSKHYCRVCGDQDSSHAPQDCQIIKAKSIQNSLGNSAMLSPFSTMRIDTASINKSKDYMKSVSYRNNSGKKQSQNININYYTNKKDNSNSNTIQMNNYSSQNFQKNYNETAPNKRTSKNILNPIPEQGINSNTRSWDEQQYSKNNSPTFNNYQYNLKRLKIQDYVNYENEKKEKKETPLTRNTMTNNSYLQHKLSENRQSNIRQSGVRQLFSSDQSPIPKRFKENNVFKSTKEFIY